jgi:iron complex transport system ATP-binding protein
MTLTISNLTVNRGSKRVVEDLSFAVPAGTVTALIGPNGAGKSTVLKAVMGLLPAVAGTVTWQGGDLLKLSRMRRAQLAAYVPQRSLLACAMSVVNVVAMGRFAHQDGLARLGEADRAAVDAALRQTDASHLAQRPFNQLSCGESQRVLLARALASGARVILMDEPTSSLDVGHALAALRLLRDLAAEGRALVVVLHHLDEVRQCADRAVLMHRGQAIAGGASDEVLAAGPLREAFGVEPVAGGALGFRLDEGGAQP